MGGMTQFTITTSGFELQSALDHLSHVAPAPHESYVAEIASERCRLWSGDASFHAWADLRLIEPVQGDVGLGHVVGVRHLRSGAGCVLIRHRASDPAGPPFTRGAADADRWTSVAPAALVRVLEIAQFAGELCWGVEFTGDGHARARCSRTTVDIWSSSLPAMPFYVPARALVGVAALLRDETRETIRAARHGRHVLLERAACGVGWVSPHEPQVVVSGVIADPDLWLRAPARNLRALALSAGANREHVLFRFDDREGLTCSGMGNDWCVPVPVALRKGTHRPRIAVAMAPDALWDAVGGVRGQTVELRIRELGDRTVVQTIDDVQEDAQWLVVRTIECELPEGVRRDRSRSDDLMN